MLLPRMLDMACCRILLSAKLSNARKSCYVLTQKAPLKRKWTCTSHNPHSMIHHEEQKKTIIITSWPPESISTRMATIWPVIASENLLTSRNRVNKDRKKKRKSALKRRHPAPCSSQWILVAKIQNYLMHPGERACKKERNSPFVPEHVQRERRLVSSFFVHAVRPDLLVPKTLWTTSADHPVWRRTANTKKSTSTGGIYSCIQYMCNACVCGCVQCIHTAVSGNLLKNATQIPSTMYPARERPHLVHSNKRLFSGISGSVRIGCTVDSVGGDSSANLINGGFKNRTGNMLLFYSSASTDKANKWQ